MKYIILLLLLTNCPYLFAQNNDLPSVNGFILGDTYDNVLKLLKEREYQYRESLSDTGNIIEISGVNVLVDNIYTDLQLFDTELIFNKNKQLYEINSFLSTEGQNVVENLTKTKMGFLVFVNEYYKRL